MFQAHQIVVLSFENHIFQVNFDLLFVFVHVNLHLQLGRHIFKVTLMPTLPTEHLNPFPCPDLLVPPRLPSVQVDSHLLVQVHDHLDFASP